MRSVGAVVLLSAVALLACNRKDAPPEQGKRGRGPMAFPVEVEKVEAREVQFTVPAVGSVQAFEVVQVTSRVSGAVERVLFAEGDEVAKGQALVEIEPARYRLAVRQARAGLEKAEAALGEAQAGLARREQAVEGMPGLIRGEELETWRTRARTAAAESSLARAALEAAELNLRDSQVRAPVSGLIQTRTVQTGQYVQPGTVLATLVRRDPLLLRFQVPERDAARLGPGMAARFKVRDDNGEYQARIASVAESADEATRMVGVTARVEDPRQKMLRAGAFAEVSVPVGEAKAPVIPQTAVRPSEKGFLAFVVADGVARSRVLALGMRTEDGRVEVREGLAAGELLVVRGAEALRDGAPVRLDQEGSPSPRAPGDEAPPKGKRP